MPGRPIISNGDTPTEKVLEFLDHYEIMKFFTLWNYDQYLKKLSNKN